ncbi:hypothetical protein R6Q59_007615 [Mikania micrantha]
MSKFLAKLDEYLKVHSFPKACVAVYPSTVQNGIVWFWPNTDPQYKDILSKKKPPYIPELDDPSFTYQMFNRDMPYGYAHFTKTLHQIKYLIESMTTRC